MLGAAMEPGWYTSNTSTLVSICKACTCLQGLYLFAILYLFAVLYLFAMLVFACNACIYLQGLHLFAMHVFACKHQTLCFPKKKKKKKRVRRCCPIPARQAEGPAGPCRACCRLALKSWGAAGERPALAVQPGGFFWQAYSLFSESF